MQSIVYREKNLVIRKVNEGGIVFLHVETTLGSCATTYCLSSLILKGELPANLFSIDYMETEYTGKNKIHIYHCKEEVSA